MKLATKFLTLLIIFICFSCSQDDEVIEDLSFESKHVYRGDIYDDDDDDDFPIISDSNLRDVFGYTYYGPTGSSRPVFGSIDKLIRTMLPSIPSNNNLCEQQEFYLSPDNNSIVFETWTKPVSNNNVFVSALNNPLNDGVISYHEQTALIDRILTTLQNNYPNASVSYIDIQANYSDNSPFVQIKVYVQTITCVG